MSKIVFSDEFKKIALCPNYPIRGFDFIAIPKSKITGDSIEDYVNQWHNNINKVKVSSSISKYSNSRFVNGKLTVTLSNGDGVIDYESSDPTKGGSHIGFIYTDLVSGLPEIMAIAIKPDKNPLEDFDLKWMTSSREDKHEYVKYMFDFGDLLNGIKCDLQINSNDESISHIESSDVDKHLLVSSKTTDSNFIIKNSADYILRSKIINSNRNPDAFMISPSGIMNYGQKEIELQG